MKAKLLLALVSVGLTLAVIEGVLWWMEPPERPDASTSGHFIRRSESIGWEGRPNATGHFANGACYGHITMDERGLRLNAPGGSHREDFSNVFFIGDSNTAGLEVDNDQTVPALLERELRERGLEVNVFNLGVRGYGTDQSVRRAIQLAHELEPEQIVYMFSDNDFFDNNVLREVGRRFGKGVYWKRGAEFEPLNYPVPTYQHDYFGIVVLDRAGRPHRYEGSLDPSIRVRQRTWLDRSWRLYRRLADRRGGPVQRRAREVREQRLDPFDVMTGPGADPVDVNLALVYGLIDGGRLRRDHRDYYDAQFEFLLRRLWEIPTVRRVHLVEFPNGPTLKLLAKGEGSDNLRLFGELVEAGVAQDFVSLSRAMRQQGLEFGDFECRGGDHLAVAGQRWIAEILAERLDFATVTDTSIPEHQRAMYDPGMANAPVIRIQRLPHAEGLDLPSYASAGAAGADLRAAVETDLVMAPGERAAVPTGLVMEIPDGWEGQVRPRSGLAIKHGLTVVNAPGTIDSDYRGEVKALLVNLGAEAVTIRRGERIAQLVLAPVTRCEFTEAETLETTDRGAGGFGSTGR